MVPMTAAFDISRRSMQMLSLEHRRVVPNEALSEESHWILCLVSPCMYSVAINLVIFPLAEIAV